MLFSEAFAQTPNAGATGGLGLGALEQFFPLILIVVVFYFFLIRPQQKKMREHRNLLSNLRRGDRIVTSGGIIGMVTKVGEGSEIQVEIAEGVRVRVVKSTVTEVLQKTEPADNDTADKK